MGFLKKKKGLSLLTKIIIAVSVSLILAISILAVISIRQQSEILKEEIFTSKKCLPRYLL